MKGEERRQRSSLSSPNDPTTTRILCFQDAWDVHYSNRTLLKEQAVKDDEYNDEDANVSNVFFELANAPSVSYRLQVLSSPSSSCDIDGDSSGTKHNRKRRRNNNNTIVIQQDVSGAAESHTGGIVWETSYLLLNYLLSSNDWLIRHDDDATVATTVTTILELGAGCGMLGLTLHKALELDVIRRPQQQQRKNKWRIILTETDEVMKNLRRNFEQNYPTRNNDSDDDNSNNRNCTITRSSSLLSVDELDWTRYKQDCIKADIESHSVDYIIGTDVVFSTRFVHPLLETLQFLSHENTIIYLCLQERCKDSHQLLLKEAINFGFHIHDISQQVFDDIPSCNFGRALECKLLKFTVCTTTTTTISK